MTIRVTSRCSSNKTLFISDKHDHGVTGLMINSGQIKRGPLYYIGWCFIFYRTILHTCICIGIWNESCTLLRSVHSPDVAVMGETGKAVRTKGVSKKQRTQAENRGFPAHAKRVSVCVSMRGGPKSHGSSRPVLVCLDASMRSEGTAAQPRTATFTRRAK